MERCGAKRSFEKPRVEAPPCLQVIGFNVSPPTKAANAAPATAKGGLDMVLGALTTSCRDQQQSICPFFPKPASTSPRSALQQLLHHQSTSSNDQSLPPPLPPNSSSYRQETLTAPSKAAPGREENSTLGLLQPATSRRPPAAPANQKWPSGGLMQSPISPFKTNTKWTGGISRAPSPTHESNSSRRCLKSVIHQSELTASDISANQSSHTDFVSCLRQSHCTGFVGGQLVNQHNTKAAKAGIGAFSQNKRAGNDGNGAEIKGVWSCTKPDRSHAPKSRKSSWLHDIDDDADDNDDDDDDDDGDKDNSHPSAAAERRKNSRWKGGQPDVAEHLAGHDQKGRKSSRSEEKSKKSSIFIMFNVGSSPAPEYHHQGHSAERNFAHETMDFLSSCHLCRRPLGQGQDVFMYSGDKAFCSMECRYEQIVIDERKERCAPPIIRSGASPVLHHTSVTVTATHHPIMINKPYIMNTAALAA